MLLVLKRVIWNIQVLVWCRAETVEGWDDFDWSWKDDDAETTSDSKELEQSSWLQDCQLSLSPSGDLIALANANCIVLLARKYTL